MTNFTMFFEGEESRYRKRYVNKKSYMIMAQDELAKVYVITVEENY